MSCIYYILYVLFTQYIIFKIIFKFKLTQNRIDSKTPNLRILLSQTRQRRIQQFSFQIFWWMNRYSNRVCATVGPCLSRKYRIRAWRYANFICIPELQTQKFYAEEMSSLYPRERVTALFWPVATRTRMFPQGICIQSRDGDRRRLRNPRKATDRLVSSPAFPLLRSSGATRRVSPGRRRRLHFKRSFPSGFSFQYRIWSPIDEDQSEKRQPSLGDVRAREREFAERRIRGERKVRRFVSSFVRRKVPRGREPSKYCWGQQVSRASGLQCQWRITLVSCRGQQVWRRSEIPGA